MNFQLTAKMVLGLGLAASFIAAGSIWAAAQEGPRATSAALSNLSEPAEGLLQWDQIYQVFSHPRCASCHVGADNIPRWMGENYGLEPGESMLHGMNVHGGMSRIGAEALPCTTCHQEKNSELPHGPPGAHVWALAPVEMEWLGKSSAQICAQIKDPARNGERSLQDVSDHIRDDELVHWGWTPGPGREPAPLSIDETVAIFNGWIAAGAPCPEAG